MAHHYSSKFVWNHSVTMVKLILHCIFNSMSLTFPMLLSTLFVHTAAETACCRWHHMEPVTFLSAGHNGPITFVCAYKWEYCWENFKFVSDCTLELTNKTVYTYSIRVQTIIQFFFSLKNKWGSEWDVMRPLEENFPEIPALVH